MVLASCFRFNFLVFSSSSSCLAFHQVGLADPVFADVGTGLLDLLSFHCSFLISVRLFIPQRFLSSFSFSSFSSVSVSFFFSWGGGCSLSLFLVALFFRCFCLPLNSGFAWQNYENEKGAPPFLILLPCWQSQGFWLHIHLWLVCRLCSACFLASSRLVCTVTFPWSRTLAQADSGLHKFFFFVPFFFVLSHLCELELPFVPCGGVPCLMSYLC